MDESDHMQEQSAVIFAALEAIILRFTMLCFHKKRRAAAGRLSKSSPVSVF